MQLMKSFIALKDCKSAPEIEKLSSDQSLHE